MVVFNILRWSARRIIGKHAVIGTENVIEDTSAVYVGNHAGAYGPIAMELFFPYKFRPWVTYRVTVRGLCRDQLEKDLFCSTSGVGKFFGRLMAFIIEPACLWVMRQTGAIPVYSGRNEIFRTFGISVDALVNGCNIVLFPENNDAQFIGKVKEFKSGFVHLARKYYRDTGKVLYFYPVFACREDRTVTIGVPVVFSPGKDFNREKERIVRTLMDTIFPGAST